MSGVLQAVFQNQRSFGPAPGQQAYTTAGTFSWIAPAGVTSVSVVTVGAGGYSTAGGSGGALSYKNNITVVPGNSYAVVVGAGNSGTLSSFNGTGVVSAGTGSTRTGDGGGNGGTGGQGGAGGYSGNGGNGASGSGSGTAGSGGGGGGSGSGYYYTCVGCVERYGYPGGGGVGLLGQGASGSGGTGTSSLGGTATGGGGGSGGDSGQSVSLSVYLNLGSGGSYGGGGYNGGYAGGGAVRIIWPGTTRSFPSTNTGNL